MKKFNPFDIVNDVFSDFKKLITILSTVIPIVITIITIVIIIIPVIILLTAFSFFFKPKIFGIDVSEFKDEFKDVLKINIDLGLENDSYVFETKTNTSIKSLIKCGLSLKENSKECFDYVNRNTGLFEIDKKMVGEDAKFAEAFEEPEDKIYLGQLELDGFKNIFVPPIYNLYKLIPKYETTSNAKDHNKQVVYDEEFIKQVYGECNYGQDYKCNELRSAKDTYAFASPSTTNLARYYGFDVADEGLVFRNYQKYSGDPMSITNAKVISANSNEIHLKPIHTDDFEIYYKGNFNLFISENEEVIQFIPLAISNNETFDLYVTYKDKYINPAILYNSSKWKFGIHDVGEKGTYIQKNVIKTKAPYNKELLEKLNFIQPMDKIIITQLANVPGVSDGGKTLHGAIDFIPTGGSSSNIKASISGDIVESAYDKWSGNYITIEDPETKIRINYCHMISPSIFKVGDKVNQGDVVGVMGNTGKSFGSHVHMQVSLPMENGEYGWIDFIDLLTDYSVYNTWQ